MSSTITIATRQSPLALCQAEYIKARLLAHHPMLTINLLGLTTVADQRLDVTLNRIGGKGLFVKELEEALLDKRADIAVHSMKDVPMVLPPGLILPVITEREDARDAFVSNVYPSIGALPKGAKVGTASLRRQTQLRHLWPDLTLLPLRGNIQTRLKRLDQGEYDAIILAAAGLHRAGMNDRITAFLPVTESLPAAGQGALGIESREGDEQILSLIQSLHDEKTAQCVIAERELCRLLEGGCQVPIGSYATLQGDKIYIRGLIANADGSTIIRSEAVGHDPIVLGKQVADGLLQQGARTILDAYK